MLESFAVKRRGLLPQRRAQNGRKVWRKRRGSREGVGRNGAGGEQSEVLCLQLSGNGRGNAVEWWARKVPSSIWREVQRDLESRLQ